MSLPIIERSSRKRLKTKMSFPFNALYSWSEFLVMRSLNWMTDTDWLYRFKFTRSLVDKIANLIAIPLIHGEVITPDEIENLIHNLEKEEAIMALGICECRHGTGVMDPNLVDGKNPNYTCVMIGDWGKGHLSVYPKYYRKANAKELIELAKFWHKNGRILTGWGCKDEYGFMISYCHCTPDYCVPLKNQLKRGNKVISPGYNFATVDANQCLGIDQCKWNCMSHCYFKAIKAEGGKALVDTSLCHGCGQCFFYCPSGACTPVRRENYELTYCTLELIEKTD